MHTCPFVTSCKSFVQQYNEKIVPLTCAVPLVIMLHDLCGIGGMVLQAIQPRLYDIAYEIASTAKSIPLKDGVESRGNVAPTIGDNSREVHIRDVPRPKIPRMGKTKNVYLR